ncbi:MAG TPA: hypothetical protein VE172_14745 [Stackebrandtia sp.]|uniref:hypothetical protein n=1 Tax=Stackebrandtia sp. TaxID=2023065 RepID=UPI002D3E716C|nr:hypothetical protein [Stackebrandtia sp.]HZE40062.1 hypothetical protein [Stackebrandtia sp.]
MSDNYGQSNPWHWHEHRIGLVGEVARAGSRALFAFLIGLGCSFVLIFSMGILSEEHQFGDPGLEMAVDHLSRLSVGVLMVLAVVVWGMFAVASCVREVATSRALVRAAERGASRYEVPSPEQVQSVTCDPTEQLTIFAWANAAIVGILGVVGLFVVLFDGDEESVLIVSMITGYAVIMFLVGLAGRKVLTPAHERRQARIAAHWSADDEGKAWRPAKQARRDASGRQKTVLGLSLAERCVYIAAVLSVLGFVALQASLTMRCANVPGPGHECHETTYSSFIENILAWGFWIFAVLLPLAGILAVVGVLLDWKQRLSERAQLRELLADPRAPRPAEALLSYHARRRMPPLALVGAALAGVGLVFSLSSYMVGQGMGLGSEDVFAVYRTESLVAVAISVGMFVAALLGTGFVNVRGREFRNELMRRWPTSPSWSARSDGKVLRAKRGPALHSPRYVKVGKNASSGQV